jgi:hypothetical protein
VLGRVFSPGVKPFDLRFGTPVHGWLEVALTGSHGTSVLVASDVPGDSLRALADAVRNLLDGRAGEVTWFLEPAEHTWRFVPEGANATISVSEDGRAAKLLARGLAAEVGLVVWRALRRLEADPLRAVQAQGRVWSHAFPHGEVAALGTKLGRTQSA